MVMLGVSRSLSGLEMSSSLGIHPNSVLRSPETRNSSFLCEDSTGHGGSKLASALRGNLSGASSVLTTSASFYGSGISDLRAAVVAQQQQFDTLVDKVAALLSAMHTELTHDIKGALDGQGHARIEELRRAGAEIDGRLVELTRLLGELHEAERRKAAVSLTELEQQHRQQLPDNSGELRNWVAGELQSLQERFATAFGELHQRLDRELHGMHKRVAGDLQDMQDRACNDSHHLRSCVEGDLQELHTRVRCLEDSAAEDESRPAWQPAIDNACACLRQEMLQEVLDGACKQLRTRVVALEERLVGTAGGPVALCSVVGTAGTEMGVPAHRRDRVDRLEQDAKRQEAAIERLEQDLRLWRQQFGGSFGVQVREAFGSSDWQHRVEQKLEVVVSVESRLGLLEQWRRRADERADRPLEQHLEPLQTRCNSLERRVNTMQGRVEDIATMLQQQHLYRNSSPDADEDQRRIEESIDRHVSGVARDCRERGRQMLEMVETLRARMGELVAVVEVVKKQVSEVRSQQPWGVTASAFGQPDSLLPDSGLVHTVGENVRRSFEAPMKQLAVDAVKQEVQHLARQLQQDLDAQLQRGLTASQHRFSADLERHAIHAQGLAQAATNELQHSQAACAAAEGQHKRLAEEMRAELLELQGQQQQQRAVEARLTDDFRRDVEARFAQLAGSWQQGDIFRQELDTRITQLQQQQRTVEARLADTFQHDVEVHFSKLAISWQQGDDFRQELDTRTLQLHGLLQRLTDEGCQLRHDLELKVAQMQGLVQRSVAELRQEVESQVCTEAQVCNAAQASAKEAQQDLERNVAQQQRAVEQLVDKLRQEVLDRLQSSKQQGGHVSIAPGMAPTESMDGGPAALEEQLEQVVAENQARCDAAVESCERCAASVQERVSAMSEDLQARLGQLSGRLRIVLNAEEQRPQQLQQQSLSTDIEAVTEAASVKRRLDSASESPLRRSAREHGLDGAACRRPASVGSNVARESDFDRRQHHSLHNEVQGFLLERKVSRCLAGLTCGRTPRGPFANKTLRKAASADSVHRGRARLTTAAARAGSSQGCRGDPHVLSFVQKQQLFEVDAAVGATEPAADVAS